MMEYATVTFVSILQVEDSQLLLLWWGIKIPWSSLGLLSSWIWRFLSPSWKLQVPPPVTQMLYSWMLAFGCLTVQDHVFCWPLWFFPRKKSSFFPPLLWYWRWSNTLTMCSFFFSFLRPPPPPPDCGCVARLLDADPNEWVPGESERQKRLSGQAVASPLRRVWKGSNESSPWSLFLPTAELNQTLHLSMRWQRLSHLLKCSDANTWPVSKCLLSAFVFTNKNVLKVNLVLNFTASSPFGASAGLSSALVNLLYDYPGLKVGEERRFQVFIRKLVPVKQQ